MLFYRDPYLFIYPNPTKSNLGSLVAFPRHVTGLRQRTLGRRRQTDRRKWTGITAENDPNGHAPFWHLLRCVSFGVYSACFTFFCPTFPGTLFSWSEVAGDVDEQITCIGRGNVRSCLTVIGRNDCHVRCNRSVRCVERGDLRLRLFGRPES
jgi:hypothetical protein